MRVLLAVAGILSAVGSSAAGPSNVQPLYRSASGPITAFAQNGSLLAWFSPRKRACNSVHVLSLGGVKLTLPKPGTNNVTCRWDVGGAPIGLALAASKAGVRALWSLHEQTGQAPVDLDYVLGATAKEPLERRFYQVAHNRSGAGLWLGGVAGDGNTLVYSVTTVAYTNQVACLSGGSCRLRITGGSVHEIVGRHNPALPHTGAALELVAASGRIAYAPAAALDGHGQPVPSLGRPVEVHSARTGRIVTRVSPAGVPLALALATHVLAVLERSVSGTRIAWYDPIRGRQLGVIGVPAKTATAITASDQLIAYRIGRVVHAIDVSSGTVRTLVTTAATPIGLSLQGSRLAWAENVAGKGRIRALFVNGRG
jgi:hypothetical protein